MRNAAWQQLRPALSAAVCLYVVQMAGLLSPAVLWLGVTSNIGPLCAIKAQFVCEVLHRKVLL